MQAEKNLLALTDSKLNVKREDSLRAIRLVVEASANFVQDQ